MKSLEVWRKGYKADFSPRRWRSKCKVSPLPCLPWDSVGGVGQGQFCILHKSGIDSPILWRSPGLSSVRVCWDCWQYGRSAWALALSGVQAGRRSFTVIFWLFLSFPFLSPVSLSSPFHLLGGAGSGVWLAGGLHRLGAAGSPSVLMLALVAVLASLGAGAGRCPLLVLRPLPLLGAVSGLWCWVSLCPPAWVLAFLCCPLVLACYALGLGAGLGRGRCWGCPGRAGGGWPGLVCADLAGC